MSNRISVGTEMHPRVRRVVLFGLAGFALAMSAVAKDVVFKPVAAVDAETAVGTLREVPAGPLAGLHFEAKVRGQVMDIYVAPMDFAAKYGANKVSKGDYVHIVGTQVKSDEGDVVIARSITTGSVDKRTGTFHEDMTIYLRNDEGPLY